MTKDLKVGYHDGDGPLFAVPDLTLYRGEVAAVIGPNGVGKTVLLKALIGSIPFEGRVEWAPGTRVRYVPQKLDLERDIPLTGRDFLRAGATCSKTPR